MNLPKLTMSEIHEVDFIWFESVLDDIDVQANGLCFLVDLNGFS